MPSQMFNVRLNPQRDRAYNAAAKAAKLELYEWVRMVCDEASGLTAPPTEPQRPLDPKGPEPVAVPIKQRKKREKVVEREKLSQVAAITVTDSPDAATTAYVIPQDDYTGATIKYHGITMYEYGKGRWTKEPPPKK